MKQLLYVGKFYPWNDKHDDELKEALTIFDTVTIGVIKKGNEPMKGQPTKILKSPFKGRIKIVYFKNLTKFLRAKKEFKYIMFER